MTIRKKLLILLIGSGASIVLLLFTGIYIVAQQNNQQQAEQIEQLLMQEKKQYLKDVVQTAFRVMERYAEVEDREVAFEKVKELLSAPRYDVDESAYFFAYQIDGNDTYSFAFHGTKKKLWNKATNIDKPDPNGVKFRRQLIENAQQQGGALVFYDYAKGDPDNIQPKMAYSMYFPKWKWVLVGGIYLDNIAVQKAAQVAMLDANLADMLFTMGGMSALLLVALGFISVLYAKRISDPLVEVTKAVDGLALGQTEVTFQKQGTGEVEAIQKSMFKLRDNLDHNAEVAERIASGDLTGDVRPASASDRLGIAFQTMVRQLSDALFSIQEAATTINDGTNQLSDSSQGLSQGASEQAASLEESSSSVAEIERQTRTNSDNALTASKFSGEARSVTASGNDDMKALKAAMEEIRLEGEKITQIIKVIDDIAFQTNLLALNANVEAARAGKYGKGFAVVAEEVRNLAVRSAKAAQGTEELIQNSSKRIAEGGSLVERTAQSLASIVETITKTEELVDGVSETAGQQVEAISQLSAGLDQISQVTQHNSANAEEMASALQVLSSQVNELHRATSHFRLHH